MCHLETALEWLRPLISDSGIWDYCVLWKLGDDPSRFIEFLGCCCNGGGKQEMGLKKRKREKNNSMQFCRDANCVHLANTESCHILASLPPYMSIYSGVHGEVVLSCQPRWLTTTKTSDSKMSIEESCGTHALIPVFGGLVELYSSKHVDEDESVIEYVKSQFNIYSELETMSTSTISFDGQSIDPFLDIKSNSGLSSLNQPNIPAWPQPNMLPSVAQRYSDSTFDGSSTGSFPSDERPSPDSNPCSVSQDIPFKPLTATPHKDPIILHEKQRLEKGSGKSKNLLTERNRRQRINDGILSLRALVPKITKMHKAATLSDAIDYIGELNNEIKELQGELKRLIEDDSDEKNTLKLTANSEENVSKPKQENSSVTERVKLKVHVQVNQLGNGNFMLRIVCQQKPGVYTKLLEALSPLDLPIKDANLTTCDGQISAIFTVESNKKEIREEDLRDSLSRLTA